MRSVKGFRHVRTGMRSTRSWGGQTNYFSLSRYWKINSNPIDRKKLCIIDHTFICSD